MVELLPDAVRIELVGEVEAALEVVGGDLTRHPCEVLQAAGRRGPDLVAADLADEDVPVVGVWLLWAPGGGQSVPVVASLQDHVLTKHQLQSVNTLIESIIGALMPLKKAAMS